MGSGAFVNGQIVATADLNIVGEEAMVAFGRSLSSRLPKPLIITLQGDLGAGKTTLSRGVLQGLGHKGAVKSPTYTLVEPYKLAVGVVYHFDLYRLVDAEELDYMGFADYLEDAALCLIEWPERGEGFLPTADVSISIKHEKSGRRVTVDAYSVSGEELVRQIVRGTGT
jgi:tRNA threonylcarbamoyladenosine biosynthesis protein TsaE|tara:strand:+ start:335 stop:841 length:507 start_codon:yes stop_codon:yes gene_type:complete